MMLPTNSQWLIVSVKEPVMFHQTADETWLFNPNRRYVINASRIAPIEKFIDSVSELEGSSLYTKLQAGRTLAGTKLLLERNRERGIGDLLFLTGPLGFLQHASGSNLEVDLMAFADRGVALTHSPLLHNGCVKCGPLEYDHLRAYDHHWMLNTVTEHDSEKDQLNVYDALYQQLGFDPCDIDPRWKRPSATLLASDFLDLDRLYRFVWESTKIDLRRIGYLVVAPFTNASLRTMNYSRWLEIIQALATRRPVVVVGNSSMRLPDTDMSAGDFNAQVASLGGGVFNAIDSTPIRVLMALIQRSTCLVGLDSAPLYMAQALNTPAIILWGTHDPRVRLGYDKKYMDLAIWNKEACGCSPCYAYGRFPVDKCPEGIRQVTCAVTAAVSVDDVLARMEIVESQLPHTLGIK